jgi:hypothetical protein
MYVVLPLVTLKSVQKQGGDVNIREYETKPLKISGNNVTIIGSNNADFNPCLNSCTQ